MRYTSDFAPYIIGLMEEKRSLGYKYSSQPEILRRFDRFCCEYYPNESVLSREIMLAWAAKRPGEHPGTLQGRITPVKELAKYMVRLGHEAFILPKGMMPRIPRYMPHIYSNDELKRIFAQTDQCKFCSEVPCRHYVMPVFFRLLYCCGLRLTEARLLKVKDVDLQEGVITVTNGKLGKHRQLPVSTELLERLKNYHQNVHIFSDPEDWFFPGYKGKPMTMGNVEKNLRKFLWKAGISHGGRGKGPRVHDFRHTMAVHCLRRWVMEGKNLQSYLPVLQAYLGHVSLSDTAYYLHLTADLFPNITEQVENVLGDIIPKAGGCDENSDFAKHLTAFFGNYLPGVKNLSENTILSYRDAFRLLLVFYRDIRGIAPKKLSFKMFNVELVCDFLNWLQNERNCSIATRNQRLIAIHAFFRYVQVQEPKQIFLCQQILQIPTKKYQQPIVAHLSPEQMKALLAAPDSSTHRGRRDMTLISVLYDTGARVQELCDLCVKDIRLEHPAIITLTGKGRKIRHVPILGSTVELLRIYLKENKIFLNGNPDAPLFFNQRYSKLTRGGVSHILQKYAALASEKYPNMPEIVTPHTIRHSKAMHLYQAGVNLIYIRDILGHADISTTDIYARADTESKRKELERAFPDITPNAPSSWNHDENLLEFLNSL